MRAFVRVNALHKALNYACSTCLHTYSHYQYTTLYCVTSTTSGGFADVQLKKGAPLLNQIVSSAIGNLPEGSSTVLNLIGSPMVRTAVYALSLLA
jgi:hypothetical protein